jgi:hypothetical protein
MYRKCRKAAGLELLEASYELKHTRKTLTTIEYAEREAHPATVVKMCEVYDCGTRLAQWHCANQCSVGKMLGRQYLDGEITLAGMKVLSGLDKLDNGRKKLVSILADGRIEPNEYAQLTDIITSIEQIDAAIGLIAAEKDKKSFA